MLAGIWDIAEKVVANKVDLDEEAPMTHGLEGRGILDEVDAMADPACSQAESIEDVVIRFFRFSRMDGNGDFWVLAQHCVEDSVKRLGNPRLSSSRPAISMPTQRSRLLCT